MLPLVAFPSLLVASLGGLLLKRLLERLEAHMEDAHCSESAMKTQAARKISMLGHRTCCKMIPVVKCNFTTVSLSPSVVAWFVCLTHGLLHPGIAALPLPVLQGLTPLIILLLSCLTPEEEQAALGGNSWLADQVYRGFCSPADSWPCPPTNPCCCISLDQFPKEGRLVERCLFVQPSHAHSLGIHKM